MSDFRIDMDTSALVQALKSLDNLEDGWAKMVSKVVAENKRMESATRQSIKAQLEAKKRLAAANKKTDDDQWFARQRRKTQMMKASAELEQRQIADTIRAKKQEEAATRQQAIEDQKAAREKDRLSQKYIPLYAASKKYERALDEITAATKQGILTDQQAIAAKDALNNEYQQFANGTAGWSNQFATGVNRMARSNNRMGMVTQQVGYQVGDFLVQVQSGQSAFVAFGQQATQLAGVLGVMNPALIGVGAALGIIIPLASAVGGFMYRAFSEAKNGVDQTTTALERFQAAAGVAKDANEILNTSVVELSETYGIFAENVRRSAEEIKALNTREALSELRGATIEFRDDLEFAVAAVSDLNRVMANADSSGITATTLQNFRDVAEMATDEVGLLEDQVIALDSLLASFSGAGSMQELASAANEVVGYLESQYDSISEAPARVQELYKQFVEYRDEVAATNKELERSGNLLTIIRGYIPDLSSGFNNASAAAGSLADNLARAATNTLAVLRGMAEAKMLREGAVGGPDRAVQETRDRLTPTGLNRDDIVFQQTYSTPSSSSGGSSGGSGGGGSAAAEKADFVEQLREEMEQRREMLQLFGQQRSLQEEIFRIEKGLGDARSEYSDEAIQALAKENILLQEREQAYEDAIALQQSLADTLENTMSDAFTSMVDGTKSFKDAMRDMARDVIKQLWDIFVVQQIVGSFDAASGEGSGIVGTIAGAFFADGAAFNKGKVTAYADGGVVSSPTLFPMANGAGLMGEAGPEAIMPLKRGKNGKLGVQTEGGGQTVVVHQSFNFSANGDDSVKKIIMQSAPSIAQMTKKTILDDRRRGGTMKRTFG